MFELSEHSLEKLKGVHPDLAQAVALAITLSTQDFAVVQGLRTEAEEAKAVATGHSKTMHSRHLTGHAVDLVPFVNGALSWDWKYFYAIVDAMKKASIQLGVKINWGACWDKAISEIGDPESEKNMYVKRWHEEHPNAGEEGPFMDGPHFQLDWKVYP